MPKSFCKEQILVNRCVLHRSGLIIKAVSHFKGCALRRSHLSAKYVFWAASIQKSNHYIPKKEIAVIYTSWRITIHFIKLNLSEMRHALTYVANTCDLRSVQPLTIKLCILNLDRKVLKRRKKKYTFRWMKLSVNATQHGYKELFLDIWVIRTKYPKSNVFIRQMKKTQIVWDEN